MSRRCRETQPTGRRSNACVQVGVLVCQTGVALSANYYSTQIRALFFPCSQMRPKQDLDSSTSSCAAWQLGVGCGVLYPHWLFFLYFKLEQEQLVSRHFRNYSSIYFTYEFPPGFWVSAGICAPLPSQPEQQTREAILLHRVAHGRPLTACTSSEVLQLDVITILVSYIMAHMMRVQGYHQLIDVVAAIRDKMRDALRVITCTRNGQRSSLVEIHLRVHNQQGGAS